MDEPDASETRNPIEGENAVGQCTWIAIHDFMPPDPPRLHVTGTCIMPTPGYQLTLHRAIRQGISPEILLLTLETQAPSAFAAQVLTPTPVSYEEITNLYYKHVIIEPEGVSVDVQEVH